MNLRTAFAFASIAVLCAASGCVTSRPARNGVFNENIYLRKAFIIRNAPGADGKPTEDPGWMMQATVQATSSPNPLGSAPFYLYPGFHSYFGLVRFRVAPEAVQLVDMRELSPQAPDPSRIPQVLNQWEATNVDLKYRVNLDGEQTNFYEENQELPWQQRQWVKLDLAKNDLSDVATLGIGFPDVLNHCTSTGESASTLVPDSVVIDEAHDYMQWTVQVTAPLRWDLGECLEAYGSHLNTAALLNKPNITVNIVYSMTRANPAPTYQPLIMAEKDPIRHKYGPLSYIGVARDLDSGQLAATEYVTRFDPTKPIVFFFDRGFPENYKKFWLGPGGIKDKTNEILTTAGAAARVDFKDFNYDGMDMPLTDIERTRGGRDFGDVRYKWLRWMSDKDMQDGFAGVAEPFIDPRTGEQIAYDIVFNDFPIKDYYVQRIDAFLQFMGASQGVNSMDAWTDPGPCYDGDTIPILDKSLSDLNGRNTLYQKMQVYMQRPPELYGNLGPTDFIPDFVRQNDPDFMKAFYAIAPYDVYRDPDTNPFVVREGGQGVYGPDGIWQMLKDEAEFHKRAAEIDRGLTPYDTTTTGVQGIQAMTGFLNRWRNLTLNHEKWTRAESRIRPNLHMDTPDAFSFEQIIARDARHCIDGHWETKEEWIQNLIDTYWSQVMWHEFGHAMGLDHNFMASVDRPNFPKYKDNHGGEHYGLYASSVMEYNAAPDRVFWHADWAPYDRAAIAWIYANNGTAQGEPSDSISGQVDKTKPWADPYGFDGAVEHQYLFCNADHVRYSPFCRPGDMGTTPSEIVSNAIVSYEWQYAWRNFRSYRKFWNNSRYADAPAGMVIDLRRFYSEWIFQWTEGALIDVFRRVGIESPDPNGSRALYYSQLVNKFNEDISTAAQLIAAFSKAVIQQGSGERPYATVYDKYFGDVTQQGIILDKLFAMQGFVALWPTSNFDQNRSGGYISSYSSHAEQSYETLAEDVLSSMVGGQYNVYPYFRPLAVIQFAQDTHSTEFTSFSNNVEIRDWTGGQPFTRLQDFLDYFRDLAVQKKYPGCPTFDQCTFDPRPLSDNRHEFLGPDNRIWIWAFIPDRNQYVAVLKDRNIASYQIVRSYNDDVVFAFDSGDYPGRAFGLELPIKYMMDSFAYFR